MAISDYSTTPSSNSSISGTNIAEGCSPSGMNDAIRQLMADLASYFGTGGTMLVGTASGAYHTIKRGSVGGNGTGLLAISDANGEVATFQTAQGAAANAANAALSLKAASNNNRSISAGGTLNASGADYAEYMTKAEGCGEIAKGQIVGVDADGKLTDRFVDAHSFVIKSTDPSYVGGDAWGVGLEGDALEAARAKVDRIAFSGQVPVNVQGAEAGDYIVPVATADGGITGVPKPRASLSFAEFATAVGKVWKILPDGRAWAKVL